METPRSCPICAIGAPRPLRGGRPVWVRGAYTARFFECRSCLVKWLHPMPPDEVVREYYAERFLEHVDREGDSVRFGGWKAAAVRAYRAGRSGWWRLAGGVARTFPSARVRGRVLDVGSGRGEFLRLHAAAGGEGIGLEISRAGCRATARAGIPVARGDVLRDPFRPGSFRAARLHHVLEHVREPRILVERLRDWLEPGGEAVVALPNGLHRSSRGRWLTGGLPGHVWHFTPASLRVLLEGAGFRVASVEEYFCFRFWIRSKPGLRRLPIPGYHVRARWLRPFRVADELVVRANRK